MALVFQMPSIVFFLAKMGVVTARWMMRYFKYAVLVIFIVAAVITPSPDMASQMLVGRADDRSVPDQHRHRVGVREEEEADLRQELGTLPGFELYVRPSRAAYHRLDHVFGLNLHHFLRPAVAQLDDAVLQTFGAHGQPQRHAEQIGVLELHARAQPVAIVVQHLEAGGFEIASPA